MLDLGGMRKDYGSRALSSKELNPDPYKQFQLWFHDAQQHCPLEPHAMTLATASSKGRPSSRTVLLKGVGDHGFVFFTNYDSRKGREIATNPFASLTFFWREVERQVIIEGRVEKIAPEESDAYFQSRPRSSQLSAWASQQGQPLESRQELEDRYKDAERRFKDAPIPRPSFWGGFRLLPDRLEFWQGRRNRLHDRFQYVWMGGKWEITRLAP